MPLFNRYNYICNLMKKYTLNKGYELRITIVYIQLYMCIYVTFKETTYLNFISGKENQQNKNYHRDQVDEQRPKQTNWRIGYVECSNYHKKYRARRQDWGKHQQYVISNIHVWNIDVVCCDVLEVSQQLKNICHRGGVPTASLFVQLVETLYNCLHIYIYVNVVKHEL